MSDVPMRCWFWFGLLGLIVGAAIPITYGQQTIYAVSSAPPLSPGTVGCGTSLLGAYLSIGLGGPLGAYVFGMIGLVVGALVDVAAQTALLLFDWSGTE